MQIILASAKIMNDKLKSVPDVSLSTPRFQNEADAFLRGHEPSIRATSNFSCSSSMMWILPKAITLRKKVVYFSG